MVLEESTASAAAEKDEVVVAAAEDEEDEEGMYKAGNTTAFLASRIDCTTDACDKAGLPSDVCK